MKLLPLAVLLLAAATLPLRAEPVTAIRVAAEAGPPLSPLLFGQFLEIASWGERGPEAFADEETGELPDAVVAKLRELNAPILRFPAGSDLPFLRWTDRIEMPGRPEQPRSKSRGEEPLTNRFTYDRFLELCGELGAEPLIVVKAAPAVVDALGLEDPEGRRGDGSSLAETAAQAAGLVAYMNAPLEPGMDPETQKWAALRAANGRFEPWGVQRWQVGNELFVQLQGKRHGDFWAGKTPAEKRAAAGRIADALVAIADAMLAVDPTIELVGEGEFRDEVADATILLDPRVRERFRWITRHHYGPWGKGNFVFNGEPTAGADLPAEALHLFGVWHPRGIDASGASRSLDPAFLAIAKRGGYEVACTEWNWNGWGGWDKPHPTVTAHARALGSAGYLHGLLRHAGEGPGKVTLATQSMMLAERWTIGSVRGNPEEPGGVYLTPTGRVASLYAGLHGDHVRAVSIENPPAPARLDLTLDGEAIGPEIGPLDVVATADDGRVLVHVIHRGFGRPLPVRLLLRGVEPGSVSGVVLHALLPDEDESQPYARTKARTRELDARAHEAEGGAAVDVELPAASVCVVEVRVS
ncbi:hypothetical protein [Phycisphaera mikurensis]|uniref:non-reducing end alpha-L-arabinofuranosidase n=1 Tax=Phycisphaera mikurensis (strain NBRC 102666 / KCTC 22515 / FYK2301M01) TaxID=1142394 RepID=I0ICZ4_PHYMF|nr:hypothetical protein [Phycisphaera mikurensis]MBB6442262.1 alpha-N-arabinofuranosidase [Phycisphaera mikurensis]BAM03132.1 hypothetical protein PSMK_09730 [Phycisphaera mikurensis NBRC 102666]